MFLMKFGTELSPKCSPTRQIRTVNSFLDLLLQPIWGESAQFFLFFPTSKALPDNITGIPVSPGLDFF